jgi:hypothetical protein
VPEREYLDLEYMDWKSGGDTNFAPIATADGQLDCRGFWNKGDERPDKGARFTTQRGEVPDARREVERSAPTSAACASSSSSRRTTTPRSAASTATTTTASTRRRRWVVRTWLELTDFPESYMLLMDTGPTVCPIRRPRSGCRCTAARASCSTRSGCGTSSCTTATRRATR